MLVGVWQGGEDGPLARQHASRGAEGGQAQPGIVDRQAQVFG